LTKTTACSLRTKTFLPELDTIEELSTIAERPSTYHALALRPPADKSICLIIPKGLTV